MNTQIIDKKRSKWDIIDRLYTYVDILEEIGRGDDAENLYCLLNDLRDETRGEK